MTVIEFQGLMESMADAFGEPKGRVFSARVSRYWERLSGCSLQDMENAIRRAEESERSFPSLKVLLDYVSKTKSEDPPKRYTEPCIYCRGEGTVVAYKDRCRYLFRCHRCSNGPLLLPEWSSQYFDAGYHPDSSQVRWDPEDEVQMWGLKHLCTERKDGKIVIREDSTAWKAAPESCRQVVREMPAEHGEPAVEKRKTPHAPHISGVLAGAMESREGGEFSFEEEK